MPSNHVDSGADEVLVGASQPFRDLLARTRKAARCDLPVLVQGESGTGKERICRLIHELGTRRRGPFIAINCSAVPETLMEGELFGTVRGSFTGSVRDSPGLIRLAHGGTVLFDEVGDMPASMQAKLLRVLQEGAVRPVGGTREESVDVRVLSASHRDLHSLLSSGRFRLDLYYRLAVIRLDVPPLRCRRGDLPLLVEHLCRRMERRSGLDRLQVSDDALVVLEKHSWPGNVRELESVLARAWMNADGGVIHACDIEIGSGGSSPLPPPGTGEPMESWMIRSALAEAAGSVTAAALRIGWTRQKLYRKMREHGLRA